jgi:GTP cyclohydrolase II
MVIWEGFHMSNQEIETKLRKANLFSFVKEFVRLRDLKAEAQSKYYNYDCTDFNTSFDFDEVRTLEENFDEACRNYDCMARVLSDFVVNNIDFIEIK